MTLLKNITIEHSERLMTFDTCDQSHEETRPGQQKVNDKDKYFCSNNGHGIRVVPAKELVASIAKDEECIVSKVFSMA